jgi:PIN domain nuclease of toxin-antitoxin system
MKFLLDTTAVILFDNDEQLLSDKALSVIQDKNHQIYLSAASIWEISIKANLGKLKIEDGIEHLVMRTKRQYKIKILPVTPGVIITQHHLKQVSGHKDPFDRLILAHAQHARMPLIARDSWFHHYPIKIFW